VKAEKKWRGIRFFFFNGRNRRNEGESERDSSSREMKKKEIGREEVKKSTVPREGTRSGFGPDLR
jgi:hypothetical protein